MIHELQRAHSRLQYVFLIFPTLMLLVVFVFSIVMMIQGEDIATVLLQFCIVLVVCSGIIAIVYNTYKQVFYDNGHIYIRSLTGKPEDTITYHDVIELIDYAPSIYRRTQGRGSIKIRYRTAKGTATIKFFRSFYVRQTDILKRQISPEKVIE